MTDREKLRVLDSILSEYESLIRARAESRFPPGESCPQCDPECGFTCMDCVTVDMCVRLHQLIKEKKRESGN